MIERYEPVLWATVLVGLTALNLREGARHEELAAEVPLSPKALYQALARGQSRLQILDARADLVEGFEDAHVPGAIPFPGCEPERAPEAARGQILSSAATVLVLDPDDAAALARCRAAFPRARVLAGGMEAWSDATLPEDMGEYSAPKSGAGGGCL